MAVEVREQLLEGWSTPIAILDDPAAVPLVEALRPRLHDARGSEPSWEVANRAGAWHSEPNLALREEAPYPALMAFLVHHVRAHVDRLAARSGTPIEHLPLDVGIQAWAVVYPNGGYVDLHDHGEIEGFSVAFSVDDGHDAEPRGGDLVFRDPRRGPLRVAGIPLGPDEIRVRAQTGRLVIFPSWLPHRTTPYEGDGERMVVSANVSFRRP